MARVAQVNAWGNLITILVGAFAILVIVLLIAAVLWFMWQRSTRNHPRSTRVNSRQLTGHEPSTMDPSQVLGLMVQMKLLEMLNSKTPPVQLPAPRDEQEADDPLSWLQR